MVPNVPIAQGEQAIAATWAHLLSLPNVRLHFGPTVIEPAASGDMAYEIGTYTLGFDSDDGRKEDRGKYVVVWKKQKEGWRAAADILNSDLPAG